MRTINGGASTIKQGMFIMPFHSPDKPLSQGYDENLELIVRAEVDAGAEQSR